MLWHWCECQFVLFFCSSDEYLCVTICWITADYRRSDIMRSWDDSLKRLLNSIISSSNKGLIMTPMSWWANFWFGFSAFFNAFWGNSDESFDSKFFQKKLRPDQTVSKKEAMFPPGLEPGTLSVLDSRDNRYSMETTLAHESVFIKSLICSIDLSEQIIGRRSQRVRKKLCVF